MRKPQSGVAWQGRDYHFKGCIGYIRGSATVDAELNQELIFGKDSLSWSTSYWVPPIVPSRILSNSNKTESIFTEINLRKKKWLICASYNPHKSNISNHLHHLGKGLDNYIGNYDNCSCQKSKRGTEMECMKYMMENLFWTLKVVCQIL